MSSNMTTVNKSASYIEHVKLNSVRSEGRDESEEGEVKSRLGIHP